MSARPRSRCIIAAYGSLTWMTASAACAQRRSNRVRIAPLPAGHAGEHAATAGTRHGRRRPCARRGGARTRSSAGSDPAHMPCQMSWGSTWRSNQAARCMGCARELPEPADRPGPGRGSRSTRSAAARRSARVRLTVRRLVARAARTRPRQRVPAQRRVRRCAACLARFAGLAGRAGSVAGRCLGGRLRVARLSGRRTMR